MLLNLRVPSRLAYRKLIALPLTLALAACGGGGNAVSSNTLPGNAPTVRVDATSTTRVSISSGEQLDDFAAFDQVNGQVRLSALAPDWFRIHAGADSDTLPEPISRRNRAAWNFSALDRLVSIAYAANSIPILNVRHAPVTLSTCASFHSAVGSLTDPGFQQFAAYMASLVAYYNLGSFSDATGIHTNPAGTSHRIDFWEIWNEPDLPYEFPCLRTTPNQPSLSQAEYAAMWAITSQRMRQVDPSIKLVGPAVSDPRNTGYLGTIITLPIPPDAISVHGYAGPNSAQDLELRKGGGDAIGIDGILAAMKSVLTFLDAGGRPQIPLLLDEFNLSPDGEDDPYGRGWGPLGVALGGSLFMQSALLAADHPMGFIPFQFVEAGGRRLSALEAQTGQTLLPYWRDSLIRQSIRPGDRLAKVSVESSNVEAIAIRSSDGGTVRVLLANAGVAASGKGTSGENLSLKVVVTHEAGRQPKSMWVKTVDALTSPASGPVTLALDPGQIPMVSFKGYGLALVEVHY